MSNKHYNADYLNETANVLKDIKLRSYNFFSEINKGKIVDLGCGNGLDAISMANLFTNKVDVIGVDHDESLINLALNSKNKPSNSSFLVSEASKLPFEPNSVAGLRAERLVQHLSEPAIVFTEIFRVLQKDAPIVIVESDWSSLCIYSQFHPISNKITEYLTEKKINNGWAAHKLISYFQENNFANTSFEVYPFVLKKLEDAYKYLWIDKIINEMYEGQILTLPEKNKFISDLESADLNQSFACSMNIVIGKAQKP